MKSFFTGIVVCAILFAAGYLSYPFLEPYLIQKPQVNVVSKPQNQEVKPKITPKKETKPQTTPNKETKPQTTPNKKVQQDKPALLVKKEGSHFVYLDKIPLFGLTESGKPKTLDPLFQAMSKELSDEEIIDLIKGESTHVDAFKGNEIQEFAVDEAFIFEEKVYQIGLVTYRKEGGIFGVQTIKAKALIRDGAIESWLNYSTNTPL